VLGAGNKVEYRPVTLGRAVGEYHVVLSGLRPGDRIVVSGLQKVKPGDVVSPQPSTPRFNTADLANLGAAG
jgi:multidrug efflux pump subunit AcrA (membrane-fusion protein)